MNMEFWQQKKKDLEDDIEYHTRKKNEALAMLEIIELKIKEERK